MLINVKLKLQSYQQNRTKRCTELVPLLFLREVHTGAGPVRITNIYAPKHFLRPKEQKIEKIYDFEEKFADFDVLETNFTKIGL